ncbi:uncharacterized protein LOC124542261 [Vanessa cardui]|uniref:uncharacterized protein LOC124542261 n=1 Tax=Vanessa cardui TaxID=171605 RepID=UPI001F13722C|nr:uncharacterized protein LOC124542261 [Vanessa cardui]
MKNTLKDLRDSINLNIINSNRSKRECFKMSRPALRKPKFSKESDKKNVVDQQFIILTLKSGMKLVVSSDSFHGILMIGKTYRCVFCDVEIETAAFKEQHKNLVGHKKLLNKFPYVAELSENLIRQINKIDCYCTICNVTTGSVSVMLHIRTDEHINELNRAILRADTYKPLDVNNNVA